MGLYNVVRPCVVAGCHHVRPATAIEIDDGVAAPLVETGDLEPFGSASIGQLAGATVKGEMEALSLSEIGPEAGKLTESVEAAVSEKPAPRPRGRRKDAED